MKRRLFLSALVLAAATNAAQPSAPLAVEGAWARPIVRGQDSSGAYMTLTAREPLTLLGAESAAAGIIEIHQMKLEGDVMRMRAAESLPLPAGQPVKLGPGGYHFMLMDLKAPFRAGTRITLNLQLRDAKGKARTVAVDVPVQPMPPRAADRQ